MRLAHRITGIAAILVFLFTGQYMQFRYPEMDRLDGGLRMLLRSRHIYILLAGLVNLGLGLYLRAGESARRRTFQRVGSGLVIPAPWLLSAAFFYEPRISNPDTLWSHAAIYGLAAGMLLHLFGAREKR